MIEHIVDQSEIPTIVDREDSSAVFVVKVTEGVRA
jgi:hypothetical protein